MEVDFPTLRCSVHLLEDPGFDAPAVTVINGNALCISCANYLAQEHFASATPELDAARAGAIKYRKWRESRHRDR